MPNFYANWPAPANISALTTLRTEGFSEPPFESNNFGLHVGDDKANVLANRERLKTRLNLPSEPEWLEQIHSTFCVTVENETNRLADAAITRSSKYVLAIITADCLPVLLCNQEGTEIAAVHAGWRGLVNGIVGNTVDKMQSSPSELLAWIGPSICEYCYEVSPDVLEIAKRLYPFAPTAFQPKGDKLLANLPLLAELILNSLGIFAVYHSKVCSLEQKNEFYSYRRDTQTGRMATLIWFNENNQDI